MQQLRAHPGQPSDPISDLPIKAPFPTREFCESWCAETDQDLLKGYTGIILVAVIFLVILLCYASCTLSAWLNPPTPGH